jgi:phosphoribosylformylglycinamidine synthase
MRTSWTDQGQAQDVAAPVSLIVSAFAPVRDVRRSLTPELRREDGTVLLLIDLAGRRQRLGGSCLAQTHQHFGGEPPDVEDPDTLRRFFAAQRELREADLLLAYHDRSDGGLFVTLAEMAFATHTGLGVEIPADVDDVVAYLFAEELGCVVQVARDKLAVVEAGLRKHGCLDFAVVAQLRRDGQFVIRQGDTEVYGASRVDLHAKWSELTFRMQSLRDDPDCAAEALDATLDQNDPGLNVALTFELPSADRPTRSERDRRPEVAVLREQGVNGQREMAAALDRAGFDAFDVHMSDLIAGRVDLQRFRGLVACGGFSYGDVLGAGEGWAKSILYTERMRSAFAGFFVRADTFTLGVCNGCQMLAALKSLIPGTDSWPRFLRNRSDQFEARFSLVRIESSPSVLLSGMAGSRMPVVTSHGEGRAAFADAAALARCEAGMTAIRYVDNHGRDAERYPANPNGSPHGIAGLTNEDGRVTIMMPHPERVFRTVQHSWHPREWGECSPWQRLFDNARAWVDGA